MKTKNLIMPCALILLALNLYAVDDDQYIIMCSPSPVEENDSISTADNEVVILYMGYLRELEEANKK